MAEQEPVRLVIDGTLDLHAFRPADIKTLLPDYLDECLKIDIFQVRIVHGKGTGALRRTVHALLGRMKTVAAFRLADETGGSWGATLVELRREEQPPSVQ